MPITSILYYQDFYPMSLQIKAISDIENIQASLYYRNLLSILVTVPYISAFFLTWCNVGLASSSPSVNNWDFIDGGTLPPSWPTSSVARPLPEAAGLIEAATGVPEKKIRHSVGASRRNNREFATRRVPKDHYVKPEIILFLSNVRPIESNRYLIAMIKISEETEANHSVYHCSWTAIIWYSTWHHPVLDGISINSIGLSDLNLPHSMSI